MKSAALKFENDTAPQDIIRMMYEQVMEMGRVYFPEWELPNWDKEEYQTINLKIKENMPTLDFILDRYEQFRESVRRITDMAVSCLENKSDNSYLNMYSSAAVLYNGIHDIKIKRMKNRRLTRRQRRIDSFISHYFGKDFIDRINPNEFLSYGLEWVTDIIKLHWLNGPQMIINIKEQYLAQAVFAYYCGESYTVGPEPILLLTIEGIVE